MTYLIPVFGVLGGYLLLGERLSPQQWIGVAIVMAAAAVITRQEERDAGPATVAVAPFAD